MKNQTLILSLMGLFLMGFTLPAASESDWEGDPTSEISANEELMSAQEALDAMETYGEGGNVISKKPILNANILSGEEAYIAPPDWEFDGFVVGGQMQEVRSLFATNDLVYLNVGYVNGIQPGERLGIYKRGDRIRDPKSGRFLGYEVLQVGIAEVTNKIDNETSSVRIIASNQGIEIGDLIRRINQ